MRNEAASLGRRNASADTRKANPTAPAWRRPLQRQIQGL